MIPVVSRCPGFRPCCGRQRMQEPLRTSRAVLDLSGLRLGHKAAGGTLVQWPWPGASRSLLAQSLGAARMCWLGPARVGAGGFAAEGVQHEQCPSKPPAACICRFSHAGALFGGVSVFREAVCVWCRQRDGREFAFGPHAVSGPDWIEVVPEMRGQVCAW